MGTVQCRNCKGTGNYYTKSRKRLDCKACRGTGINQKLYSTRCENGYCSTEIIYPRNKTAPKYCKSCRNQQQTKTCAQYNCYNTITYKLGWSNVSNYCRYCDKMRKQGATAKSCSGQGFGASCGKLIWVPRGKNFTMCRDCNERARAKKAAQWKEKSCPKCSYGKIKYHVDWNNIPKMCKTCKEKEQSKWKERSCKGCSNKIKYNVDWTRIPDHCKTCNQWQYKTCKSCHNQVKYKKYWSRIPDYCKDCFGKNKKKNITTVDIYRANLIPSGWNFKTEVSVKTGHVTIYFPNKGTNGKGYRVSWDGTGKPHWTDQGLDRNHPNRHRDPRS